MCVRLTACTYFRTVATDTLYTSPSSDCVILFPCSLRTIYSTAADQPYTFVKTAPDVYKRINVQNQNCKHSSINSSSFAYNCIKHPRFARTVQIAVNQLGYSYGYSVKEILCKLRYNWNTILCLRYIKEESHLLRR